MRSPAGADPGTQTSGGGQGGAGAGPVKVKVGSRGGSVRVKVGGQWAGQRRIQRNVLEGQIMFGESNCPKMPIGTFSATSES